MGNDNRAGFRRTHEYTGVFNSAVMKQTSMWVSAGWVQISAFVVCLLMWLFTGRGAVSELWQIEPRYMLTGGVMVFVWKYLVKPMGGVWGIYELLPAFILGCYCDCCCVFGNCGLRLRRF